MPECCQPTEPVSVDFSQAREALSQGRGKSRARDYPARSVIVGIARLKFR
jgi:hypothetical protein